MVDPYLSDSIAKVNPANYRRVAVKEDLFDIHPDVMIFTHNHMDHFDPQTATRFLSQEQPITVLSPQSVWAEARKNAGGNNYVNFNRHTVWTFDNIRFTAVKAEHSDPYAIGVIIDDGEKKYYVSGDTLYNTDVLGDLPKDIYAVFLPINGIGNNMNMTDAADFAEKAGAKFAVPVHFGMFDEIDPTGFKFKNTVIPEIYKEIKL